jgi:hypothetical protein
MASAAAMFAAVPAFAQGCAMCYNNAAASKAAGIQALKSGTLILLIPVLLLFAGILAVAFRSRNRFNAAVSPAPFGASGTETDWAELLRAEELERLVVAGEKTHASDEQGARP